MIRAPPLFPLPSSAHRNFLIPPVPCIMAPSVGVKAKCPISSAISVSVIIASACFRKSGISETVIGYCFALNMKCIYAIGAGVSMQKCANGVINRKIVGHFSFQAHQSGNKKPRLSGILRNALRGFSITHLQVHSSLKSGARL